MGNTELLMKLRELHEELASINDELKTTEQIDDATINALGELVSDVGGIVDQVNAPAEQQFDSAEVNGELPEHRDLLDRIRQFEAAHPRVTRFLSQLTDLLALIGI